MTDEPLEPEVGPDEIKCRKCGADEGDVCRQPNGKVAASIHVVRRRDAERANRTPSEPRPSPGTSEGRSRGGKRAAQERRRRKSELAAQVEAKRVAAENAAIENEAERLAADAARYATDRNLLRRATLENALASAGALGECLRDLRRLELDAEGFPKTQGVEVFDRKTGLPVFDPSGERVIEQVPIVKGYTTPQNVETLSKAAAQQLVSVRLEEGKPTGIHEHLGDGGASKILGDAGVRELLEFAERHLPDEGKP